MKTSNRTRTVMALITLIPLMLGGCSGLTRNQNMFVGAASGAGAGAGIGTATDALSPLGIGVSALGGALLGGVIGFLLSPEKGNSERLSQTQEPQVVVIEESGGNSPQLSDPKVRRVWIPPKIEGDRYVPGHFVHEIENPRQWRTKNEGTKNNEKANR